MATTTLGVPGELRIVWGSNLRAARLRAGFSSQGELAAALGCTRQAVSNWERGVSAPSHTLRVEIARVLHRSPSRLFPAA